MLRGSVDEAASVTSARAQHVTAVVVYEVEAAVSGVGLLCLLCVFGLRSAAGELCRSCMRAQLHLLPGPEYERIRYSCHSVCVEVEVRMVDSERCWVASSVYCRGESRCSSCCSASAAAGIDPVVKGGTAAGGPSTGEVEALG